MTDQEITKITVKLPSDLVEALKNLSGKTRVPQAAYFREAIEDLLRKYEEPRKVTKPRG